MKRPSLIVLLAGALALASWVVAQPPAPEGQDPPVRLKRKKQRPAQEQPPPKPDKAEQPDPAEDPKKKPDDRPKPKLDEEERLDPKDDLKLPAGEPRDVKEVLERITRNARLSEERLTNRELDERTRTVQQEILTDIDSLIEQAKNQDDQNDQSNQNDQNNQDKQDGQGGPGASGGEKERQGQQSVSQRRQRRQSARRRGRDRQGNDVARNTQPKQGEGNNPGGGGSNGNANKEKPTDRAFDRWGHLPEKERALMQKEMEQKFMEKYDDLTKQYYRIIAEKSRRKK